MSPERYVFEHLAHQVVLLGKTKKPVTSARIHRIQNPQVYTDTSLHLSFPHHTNNFKIEMESL